ncbi:uncharacterized protein LOC144646921 isoform X1 [Oculina patagonica]
MVGISSRTHLRLLLSFLLTFTRCCRKRKEVIPTKDVMQDFKNSYLPSIIILLFLIRLGASQHFNGGDTSSSTNAPNIDKKTLDFINQLMEIKKNNVQERPKYNTTSAAELHNIVKTRFRTEMAMLFSWLPEFDKCNILSAVSQTTQCSVPEIIELLFSLTEMKHNLNVSCPVKQKTKFKICRRANKTFVGDTFCKELLDVFASLPSPFKCHVINTIALAYSLKGRRHLSLTVSQAQNAVAELFPSVSLPQTCADMEMNHIVPSIPPVNITVYLNNADKHTWLRTLAKKGPVVYKTVLEYEFETRNKGKVLGLPSSPAQYLAAHKEEINSTQLFTVVVEGGDKLFSVLFRLKVKRKQSNRLREIRSTFRIAQALAAKDQKELRAIFNATIISISLSGERSNITKAPPKSNKWTLNQINRAKEFFPAHLSEYYKQLGKPARCFLVFYISQKINKTPKEIEMFYASFGRFSRKHTCYYTRRTVPTEIPIKVHSLIEERFNQDTNALSTQAPSLNSTGIPSNGSGNAVDNVSSRVDEEDLSSLEIALFVLLGVLCVSVLAFTINCVMLAMKSKASYQSNAGPKTALQTAVFHKGTNVAGCKENERVHFPERSHHHCQPSNSQHSPTTGATCISCSKNNCNCPRLVSASHHIRRCDHERTCLENSHPELHDRSGENRTNSRTQLENEYCSNSSRPVRTFKSSQLCQDDREVKDSPDTERSSSKTECQCPTAALDNHSLQDNDRVLESQGRAISYCSISDTSCRAAQSAKIMQTGRLPSEEAHETVIVLLDCKGYKEAQV